MGIGIVPRKSCSLVAKSVKHLAEFRAVTVDHGMGGPIGGVVLRQECFLVANRAEHFLRVPGPWPGTI
jgi:hypothetical protein